MRRLKTRVRVSEPGTGRPVILEAGGDVPEWAEAQITNPAAWEFVPDPVPVAPIPAPVAPPPVPGPDIPAPDEGGEPDPGPDEDAPEPDGADAPDYTAMTKADLLALIRERNAAGESIPTDGNKADLIDALELADKADEGEAGSDDSGEV